MELIFDKPDNLLLVKGHSSQVFHFLPKVGSASRKRSAANARATTLKILRRKRFRKPKKIIAPQAQV